MKRNLLALFAIVLAIGFSAFTNVNAKKETTNYYWFKVKSGVSITPGSFVQNADVEYLNEFDNSAPSVIGCDGGTKYCVVGFSSAQVSGAPGEILEEEVPEAEGSRRN